MLVAVEAESVAQAVGEEFVVRAVAGGCQGLGTARRNEPVGRLDSCLMATRTLAAGRVGDGRRTRLG
jgi:hypothetical protein